MPEGRGAQRAGGRAGTRRAVTTTTTDSNTAAPGNPADGEERPTPVNPAGGVAPSPEQPQQSSQPHHASAAEEAATRRQRQVTQTLDTKAHAYLATIATNKARTGFWQDLTGEVDPDTVRGFNVRAVGIRVTGWRYIPN